MLNLHVYKSESESYFILSWWTVSAKKKRRSKIGQINGWISVLRQYKMVMHAQSFPGEVQDNM